jgi:polyisoprenoid-binding protein YceI
MTIRSLLTLAALAFAGVATSLADNYKIDPVHSAIILHINHFGVGTIYGRFDSFSGDLVFDPDDPSKTSLSLEIKTDSVDTNAPARDKDLKGPDFLNTAQFGTATFKTTSVKKAGDQTFEVTGDLTLRGVTKPVTATVKEVGIGKGPKGEPRIGFETSFQVKRSDFDIKYGLPVIGDDVFVTVAFEGIKS